MSTHRIFLAGSGFADRDIIAGDIPEGTQLILCHEPDNQYDANAVSVWVAKAALAGVGLDLHQPPNHTRVPDAVKLGMLPASKGPNWARIVAEFLAAGTPITATFRRHQKKQIRIVVDSAALPEAVA